MNRSLSYYLGLFRKHWIQILLIGTLVGVGGYLYLSRQVPVFRATTKLRIIRQQGRSSRDVSFTFEEDQVFYNTQYDLLQTQIDWAGMLLNRVAYRVVQRLGNGSAREALDTGTGMTAEEIVARLDGAAGPEEFAELEVTVYDKDSEDTGDPKVREAREARARLMDGMRQIREEVILGRLNLTPDRFLAGITARPIPGTHLAELSYRAENQGVAVLLVNMYAELYRDVSRGERELSLQGEVSYRIKKQEVLKEDLDAANAEQDEATVAFGTHDLYGHLNPAGGDNPFQQQADAVAGVLNEKQIEKVLQDKDEDRLRKVLREEGFLAPASRADEAEFHLRRLDGTNGKGTLHADLAENLTILALPAVQSSENVNTLRTRLQLREDERSRLLERFTETSEEVREAEGYIAAARRKLGAEVEATILRFLLAGQDLADVISTLDERVQARQKEAKALNEAWENLAKIGKRIAGLEERYATLERERVALLDLGEKQRESGPLAIENIRIERRARLQDSPMIHPNPVLIIALTVFAAFVLSFGSVFLVEFFDDTIKTKDDFDRYVTVPDLGFIPRIGEKEFKHRDTAVLEKPRSSVAEAFRSLRTGILFSRRDEEIQVFLVSSAGPGEGKTTVATNLAITMAEAGRGKVLVIDADLRKARLHTALGIENGPGLTNCLVGSATLDEVVRPTPVENLYVLTSGPTPPNPAELLGGHRMAEILETARGEYGKIVIDTPPLVAVTDTSLLAPLVQGLFLVVSMGKTSWRLIERAKQSLAAVGEEITGGIVNDVRSSHRGYGYGYGYTYDRYYGKAEDAEE